MLNLSDKWRQERLIIACSGGSDSMALLDLCTKAKMNLIVCHVNYHQRESSRRDQQIVDDYCRAHRLQLEVLDGEYDHQDNFEKYARILRYDFFVDTAQKYGCKAVLVAHQRDDDLETYLLQKQRGIQPEFYGLKAEVSYKGLSVLRPLLSSSKQDLEEYCHQNGLDSGFDETNASDDFSRNRLRKHLVKLPEEALRELWKQRENDQKSLFEFQREAAFYLEGIGKKLNLADYCAIPQSYRNYVLRCVLKSWNLDVRSYSEAFLSDLDRKLGTSSGVIPIKDGHELLLEKGVLSVFHRKDYEFSYKFGKIEPFHCPQFHLESAGHPIEGVTLYPKDFPILIRSGKADDSIQMRYGTKKLNRFFIDRKISYEDRLSWIVIENSAGHVIFVDKLGCDLSHYSNNPSMFVIKYDSLED